MFHFNGSSIWIIFFIKMRIIMNSIVVFRKIWFHPKAPKLCTVSSIIITRVKTLIGLVDNFINYTYYK